VVGVSTESQKTLQTQFDSRKHANRLEQAIVTDQIIPELHQAFIESRDFFLLATVNAQGEPTVSHKGGEVPANGADRIDVDFLCAAATVGEPVEVVTPVHCAGIADVYRLRRRRWSAQSHGDERGGR
jgi:hypothetical protein